MNNRGITFLLALVATLVGFLAVNVLVGANISSIWIISPELDQSKIREIKDIKVRDIIYKEEEFISPESVRNESNESVPMRNTNNNNEENNNGETENIKTEILNQDIASSSNKTTTSPKCDIVDPSHRFDCHPEVNGTRSACEARGCCWHVDKRRIKPLTPTRPGQTIADVDIPACYYPTDYGGYYILSKTSTDLGFSAVLQRDEASYYANDVKLLLVEVMLEENERLHVKIDDAKEERYEVPIFVPQPTRPAPDPHYIVSSGEVGEPFHITVTRKGDKLYTLFSTKDTAPLIYTDQFIQLSSVLTTTTIYGIGEHRGELLLDTNWTQRTLWNRDHPPVEGGNLYGSHPFYIVMEEDGKSNGFFLLNSNAMDVILQPYPAITWKTIGGILDFYMFVGDSPSDIIRAYTDVVGKPALPPYWSLGFHICKFGYKSVNDTLAVTNRVRKAGIPQDVQWNDIDYADGQRDFTTDKERFGDQSAMVKELHARGMHYVIITDPGISNSQPAGSYRPYDYGMELDIFVKNESGQPLVGKVWPGTTVWVDFMHPKAQQYWTTMIREFHTKVPIDGLWIDMNEVSNFVDGSIYGCSNNSYNYPPYVPGVLDGKLYKATICPSAIHYKQRSYNVHSLYGLYETMATNVALREVRGRRPFIISRSTFSGQGHYGGHWSGDNIGTFHDMYRSISETLNMNLFGTPLAGVDICGFRGNTTYNLCLRWYQLGAFYPYSRNHNNMGNTIPQDPAAFDDYFATAVQKVYRTRYSLLPYLYSLFFESHIYGYAVARPMFYEFQHDKGTYALDQQFMWGSALLIAPVVQQYAIEVSVHLPADSVWYNFYTGERYQGYGDYVRFKAPTDTINLLVQAGTIIPRQTPALTTTESRKNPFQLLVAISTDQTAEGKLFWDDGDSLEPFEKKAYDLIEFHTNGTTLMSIVKMRGYNTSMVLDGVTIYGCKTWPSAVYVNSINQYFTYNIETQVLKLPSINPRVDLLDNFVIQW